MKISESPSYETSSQAVYCFVGYGDNETKISESPSYETSSQAVYCFVGYVEIPRIARKEAGHCYGSARLKLRSLQLRLFYIGRDVLMPMTVRHAVP
jgi:hypothetical protein